MSDLKSRFLSAADRFQGVLQVVLAGTQDKAKLQGLEQELLAQPSTALIETFCTIRFLRQYGQYLAAYVLTPRPIAQSGQPLAAQAMAAWKELLRELGGDHSGWEALMERLLKRPASQGWEWRPSGEWALGCNPKGTSWLVQQPNLFRLAAELLDEVRSQSSRSRRGRKPKYDSQADAQFAAEWERAKGEMSFKQFCKDKRKSPKEGEAILARVRMRKAK
jgi:hypothetical protein